MASSEIETARLKARAVKSKVCERSAGVSARPAREVIVGIIVRAVEKRPWAPHGREYSTQSGFCKIKFPIPKVSE